MIVGHELDWGKPVGHEIMPPYKEYPQGNHFVIYTKPNCIQCKMSIRLMDRLGTMYEHTYYGDATQTNDINISSTDKATKNGHWIR